MTLEECPVVFNTSVRFKHALSLAEGDVLAFFGQVMQALPALNEYRRSDEGKADEVPSAEMESFDLIQRGKGRNVRQLRLRKSELVLAAAPPLRLSEADQTARVLYPIVSERLHPSPLSVDYLDVSFRFEMPYRGNHNQLVLTKLFGNTPLGEVIRGIDGAVFNFEPEVKLSISSDHSVIAVLTIRTATTPREIESGDYDGDEIQVLCGVAKVRGLAASSLEETYALLFAQAVPFVEQRVLIPIVETLQNSIREESFRARLDR